MLERLKSIVKQSGLYNSILKLIIGSNLATQIFLGFISIASNNKQQLNLETITINGVKSVSVENKNRKIYLAVRHIAYIQDVLENFDYYFQSVVPKFDGSHQIVDYSKPNLHTLNTSGLSFYFTSFVEPMETNDIYLEKGNLKNGYIVFDLGAYCGLSTYSFSQIVGETGHIYALEPDTENFNALTKNIQSHQLINVTSMNKGIWSTTKRLLFQSEANMGSGVQTIVDRQLSAYEIDAISLDDMCRLFSIERVDYVKMDIEGSEIEVLKSAENFLIKYKPRLIIEAHIVKGILTTNDICAILEKYKYSWEIIPQAGLPLPLIYAYPNL